MYIEHMTAAVSAHSPFLYKCSRCFRMKYDGCSKGKSIGLNYSELPFILANDEEKTQIIQRHR